MWLVVMTIIPHGKCLVMKRSVFTYLTAAHQQCPEDDVRVRGHKH